MDQADKFRAGPTDFLAAERTFLAWMRTGLGFGLFFQSFPSTSRCRSALF
jgi:uncharacterized membrane protein YidH (DUF202 family)